MTKHEFSLFSMALQSYYPRVTIFPNTTSLDLWYGILKDLDYTSASNALTQLAASEPMPPSIADIRKRCFEIERGEDIPDWSKCWGEVEEGIRRWGTYGEERAMQEMSPITVEAVQRLGWTNLCLSDNPSADRARFKDIIQDIARREARNGQTPPEVRALIDEMQRGRRLEAGDVT